MSTLSPNLTGIYMRRGKKPESLVFQRPVQSHVTLHQRGVRTAALSATQSHPAEALTQSTVVVAPTVDKETDVTKLPENAMIVDIKNIIEHNKHKRTLNVMAPLRVTDANMKDLDAKLEKLKGVADGVSFDVWWGDVQKDGEDKFNWSNYDKAFELTKKKGLKVIPILSFHKCGGNVGDGANTVPLPQWAVDKVEQKDGDVFYQNAHKEKFDDYIALWHDDTAIPLYKKFMTEFKNHYEKLGYDKESMPEVNVSLGPTGELRYPSYGEGKNPQMAYPNPGEGVGLSDTAKSKFRDYLKTEGLTETSWAKAANGNFSPPTNPETFWMKEHGYNGTAQNHEQFEKSIDYGPSFMKWYHGALVKHEHDVLETAAKVFSPATEPANKDHSLGGTDIGMKLTGVHWAKGDDGKSRAAEAAAGLQLHDDFANEDNTYGYKDIITTAQQAIKDGQSDVMPDHRSSLGFHFTCAEKTDLEYEGLGARGNVRVNSKAETLFNKVAETFKKLAAPGAKFKAENALAGACYDIKQMDKMREKLAKGLASGLTVLRLGDLVNGMNNLNIKRVLEEIHGLNKSLDSSDSNNEEVVGKEAAKLLAQDLEFAAKNQIEPVLVNSNSPIKSSDDYQTIEALTANGLNLVFNPTELMKKFQKA